MIKLLGAIVLIGAAGVIGFSASATLAVRERALRGFLRSFQTMRSEIGDYLTPLEEIMERLSHECTTPLDMFFRSCLSEMREKPEMPFRLIWTKNIKRADYLKLKKEETEEIASLGNVLGRYGSEEQKKAIEHTARRIESMAITAEREKKRLGGVYARLGVISGLALVIVFI